MDASVGILAHGNPYCTVWSSKTVPSICEWNPYYGVTYTTSPVNIGTIGAGQSVTFDLT